MLKSSAVFCFSTFTYPPRTPHDRHRSSSDAWYRNVDKTSQTDDQRIEDITVLPLPNT
ncbi:phospho-2-dehydro-3-deoxyheptonate aldolase [Alicycliphilus sp. B1]|nr:phospho-2-dehydro-3-deoxyheptonate aldolase [Alicycliphilus sp. B1]